MEVVHNFTDQTARQRVHRVQGAVGADLDAAATPDASVIVEGKGLDVWSDRFCRANGPAGTAMSAKVRLNYRPWQEMKPDDALQNLRPIKKG